MRIYACLHAQTKISPALPAVFICIDSCNLLSSAAPSSLGSTTLCEPKSHCLQQPECLCMQRCCCDLVGGTSFASGCSNSHSMSQPDSAVARQLCLGGFACCLQRCCCGSAAEINLACGCLRTLRMCHTTISAALTTCLADWS